MSASTIPERRSEKYGKKLIRKSDMGNVLKKLDKLTQEEALMISAENLKATYTVGEMVKKSDVRHLLTSPILAMKPYTSPQKTSCGRMSTSGSSHQIHQLTITLCVVLMKRNFQRGSSKETFTRSGNPKVRSFGSTESVRPVPVFHPRLLMTS